MTTSLVNQIVKKDILLAEKLTLAAELTMNYLESKLKLDGSFENAKDLSCYYKSPMLFVAAKKSSQAKRILNYIKQNFMTADGDFLTSSNLKSEQAVYQDFWTYINGWIIRAANYTDEREILEPALKYFSLYKLANDNGFLTNRLSGQNQISDILTVAHHGLINLELSNNDNAISAGKYLCDVFAKQTNLAVGFFTRTHADGQLITDFTAEERLFYFVSRTEPEQLFFLLGYPAAYLTLLYQKTKSEQFLQFAKAYLDFALSCHENVYQCNFSHKIAWAASYLYKHTGNETYLQAIERISDHFIAMQDHGMWYLDNMNAVYDQSAEIALWFLEIAGNIRGIS